MAVDKFLVQLAASKGSPQESDSTELWKVIQKDEILQYKLRVDLGGPFAPLISSKNTGGLDPSAGKFEFDERNSIARMATAYEH